VDGLDRAGLVYELRAPAGGETLGTTIALGGTHTGEARLAALARASAPDHRVVLPEPLRFLYLSRDHVGRRWYVTSIDGEIEPATFADALFAVEQLAIAAHEQWDRRPLLIGHGQGGALALALALLVPDRLAGVAAVGAAIPRVPGWERPDCAAGGLPVLLVPGHGEGAAAARARDALTAIGAQVERSAAGAAADALGPSLDAVVARWWRGAATWPRTRADLRTRRGRRLVDDEPVAPGR
jgi:pimeloyl-ACP methyl ester carboxylesterase